MVYFDYGWFVDIVWFGYFGRLVDLCLVLLFMLDLEYCWGLNINKIVMYVKYQMFQILNDDKYY